jgi:hypothetical protein
MTTPNQACISKLEFGEPSSVYNGTNFIEMNFNAFNLSRLPAELNPIQESKVTFWSDKNVAIFAGLGGFTAGIMVFIFWARRPFSS